MAEEFGLIVGEVSMVDAFTNGELDTKTELECLILGELAIVDLGV